MKIEFSGSTAPGRIRKENQDYYGIIEKDNIFFVCDGMGGHASGDFASRAAVEVFIKAFASLKDTDIIRITDNAMTLLPERSMRPLAAIRVANSALFDFSQKYPKLEGMGTTIAVLQYNPQDETIDIFNVGDSRVYLVREKKIYVRTKDHSKVAELIAEGKMREEEVQTAEIQSMITRALGIKKSTRVDFRIDSVIPGDRVIVCSDGLNSELSDEEIKNIVLSEPNIADVSDKLIDAANAKGGRDNITVIAVEFSGENKFGKRPSRPIVVLDEETKQEGQWIEKAAKNILNLLNIEVPKKATDNGIFSNPLVIGAFLCVLVVAFAIFAKKFNLLDKVNKIDVTHTSCLFKVQVRTPIDAQLDAINSTEDKIQKLQMIQDWYKKLKETTRPVKNAEIRITKKGKEEFRGLSADLPLEANIQRGEYTISAVYKDYSIGSGSGSKARDYYIVSEKFQKLSNAVFEIEVGENEKLITLIILPEINLML